MPYAINVSVEGTSFQYRLTEGDLKKVFTRYGSLGGVSVSPDGSVATVWFMEKTHADSAVKQLDGKVRLSLVHYDWKKVLMLMVG